MVNGCSSLVKGPNKEIPFVAPKQGTMNIQPKCIYTLAYVRRKVHKHAGTDLRNRLCGWVPHYMCICISSCMYIIDKFDENT